jgi:hypothetical protein
VVVQEAVLDWSEAVALAVMFWLVKPKIWPKKAGAVVWMDTLTEVLVGSVTLAVAPGSLVVA